MEWDYNTIMVWYLIVMICYGVSCKNILELTVYVTNAQESFICFILQNIQLTCWLSENYFVHIKTKLKMNQLTFTKRNGFSAEKKYIQNNISHI